MKDHQPPNLEPGDRIRVATRYGNEDHDIELFRGCLGFFWSPQHRQAGEFTPLCSMYEPGPESRRDYIGNFGEYYTNKVPAWMQLPKQTA